MIRQVTIFLLLLVLLIHQTRPTSASDPPGPPTRPENNDNNNLGNQNFNPSMGVVIIVLIAALFFMGFFSIYIRHCSDDATSGRGGSLRARVGSVARSRRAPRGLDPGMIESFPTFNYAAVKSLKIGKGALECAVCLTEFEDDDTLRLIPKCDHVFHPDCIDAWLVGHTTCPVCRSNLVPDAPPSDSPHAPDVAVQVGEEREGHDDDGVAHENEERERESMEQPLHGSVRGGMMSRNRTMRRNLSIGRPRWLLGRVRFARSFSTGHVAVKQWENMERFTLRLPDDVRKQVMSGKLERTTSLLVLPRENSSRRGYRTGPGPGFGEGSSRGGPLRFGSARVDRGQSVRSDRWVFSLAPPFFSRQPSAKVSGPSRDGSLRGSVRDGSLRGSIRTDSSRLPV